MRTIKILLPVIILSLSTISCRDKQEETVSNDNKIIQTPPTIANNMRFAFVNNGMCDKLDSFMINIEYPIEKFIKLTDGIEDDKKKNYTLRIYFIQISQDFRNRNLNFFSKEFVDKLYIAFCYFNDIDQRIQEPFLFDISGEKKNINIMDLKNMHEAYQCNIKSKIVSASTDIKNTDYVKVNVEQLFDYIKKIKTYLPKAKKMKFELTETTLDNKAFLSDQIGYLAFFNNVTDNSGKNIAELSDYNMNSLCPNQCP